MAIARLEREMAARGDGCLGRADPDEPVFILRAQDVAAPRLVDMWADLVEVAGGSDRKVSEARDLAANMREWQANHSERVKVPD